MFIKQFLSRKFDQLRNKEPVKPPVTGVQFGALISIDPVNFIASADSLLADLEVDMMHVVAVSRVRVDSSDIAIRRYYLRSFAGRLSNATLGSVDDAHLYLQVIGDDPDNLLYSIHRRVSRYTPETREELEGYQGKTLGTWQKFFKVASPGDLMIPLPEFAQVTLQKNGCLEWRREIEGGDAVAPLHGQEEIIYDKDGLSGELRTLRFMPYLRTTCGSPDRESMEIALNMGVTKNYQPSNLCHVDFFAGIEVPKDRLKFYTRD